MPVPAQDGARSDQAVGAQPCWHPPDEGGEHGAVGPVQARFWLVRRSTATSCRSTRSSTFLVEDVRPVSMSSPSTCWKTRYSSRSDMAAIMPNRWRPSITAGQQRAPRSGTPHDPAGTTHRRGVPGHVAVGARKPPCESSQSIEGTRGGTTGWRLALEVGAADADRQLDNGGAPLFKARRGSRVRAGRSGVRQAPGGRRRGTDR
jgi:hypothetical protein